MPRAGLKILGGFEFTDRAGATIAVTSRKGRALLAYLALNADRRHDRAELSALLWSGRGEAQARGSLNQCLLALRKATGDSTGEMLESDRDSVILHGAALELDVARLRALAASDESEDLAAAAALYEGELLAGAAPLEGPYEDWLRAERESIRRIATETSSKLAEAGLASGDAAAAEPSPGRDDGGPEARPIEPDKPSIAVLAFNNMSDDEEQEYFTDGITEDIITALSTFRNLFVIARNSTFTYKDQAIDVQRVGRELGVRYVMEGSVRKAGNRVRVTAQLIDADTGRHIWAERYDRDLDDIFAVQDEITENVVSAVMPALDTAEQQRSARKAPDNVDAWDCYQRGIWHLNRFKRENFAIARGEFGRAIELDPRSALGFIGLASLGLLSITRFLLDPGSDEMNDAYEAAKTAVALDDLDSLAHVSLGWLATLRKEALLAEAEYRRAIDLTPSMALAHSGLGSILTYTGRVDEGKREIEIGERLNPRDPYGIGWKIVLASGDFLLGRDEACLATVENVLAVYPRWMTVLTLKAASLSMLGRREEAYALEAQAHDVRADYRPPEIDRLLPYCDDKFLQRLHDALEQAGWAWD